MILLILRPPLVEPQFRARCSIGATSAISRDRQSVPGPAGTFPGVLQGNALVFQLGANGIGAGEVPGLFGGGSFRNQGLDLLGTGSALGSGGLPLEPVVSGLQ